MNKDNPPFSKLPILGQLLTLFPRNIFDECVAECNSDSAHRTVSTWSHFVFMSYGVLTGSSTLREIYRNFELLGDKITHLGLAQIPARSSISDANRDRDSNVFGQFYFALYNHFKPFLSDSFLNGLINGEIKPSDVHIFDSTTVSLFKDKFKNAGRIPLNGQIKGGIKAFTKVILGERVPNFICLRSASTNEKLFLNYLELSPGTIAVFDKGFQKFSQYAQWTAAGIYFVTRLNSNCKFKILKNLELEQISEDGVVRDSIIELTYFCPEQKKNIVVKCRMVAYIDPISKEELVFVTNHFEIKPLTVSLLYKNRWVIEPLFKQIKQNFELTYFLADSQEGIKTQIWIAMILNLLFTVIHKMTKEAEDFSTLVKLAAKNLYSYVNFINFIKDPKIVRKVIRENIRIIQMSIFENTRGG
jgi:hypothetical protein